MSGKGKTKNGSEGAAAPAPADEDPLEVAVEEALEHSYARRMLEIDDTPKGEPKEPARPGEKPAGKKPKKRKPPH